jgi:hypothetical protein
MTTLMHEIAISALPYESMLVADLAERLNPLLSRPQIWSAPAADPLALEDGEAALPALAAGRSRMALVLHQRLWARDSRTQADAAVLRERVKAKPKSVLVVTLDDAPVPAWLGKAPRLVLADIGIDGVVQRALKAVVAGGGALRHVLAVAAPEPANETKPWFEERPFLATARATSALQRELDLLATELGKHVGRDTKQSGGPTMALRCAPGRYMAQVGELSVSFSWVADRSGSVADGRLMVIEWDGAISQGPGTKATSSATPILERVFRPEATGPADWRWRADDAAGQAYSSPHLAAQSLAAALITAAETA